MRLMQRKKYASVRDYIADFEGETRERLEVLRRLIMEELPSGTVEKISYNIPTYTMDPSGKGYLLYMAGFDNHIGLYPVPLANGPMKDIISKYQKGKGTLRFGHNEPLPLEIIRQIIRLYEQSYRRPIKK